jgi:hypothetical protein
MTRQQALATYLLTGKPVSIKNGYNYFGISNISREVIRLIEKPFGVHLTRTKKEGKTKYGTHCIWLEYILLPTKLNAKGINAMKRMLKEEKKKVAKMNAIS